MARKAETRPVDQRLLVDRRGRERGALPGLHQAHGVLDGGDHMRGMRGVRDTGAPGRPEVPDQHRQIGRGRGLGRVRDRLPGRVPRGRCAGSPIHRIGTVPFSACQAAAATSGPIAAGSPQLTAIGRISCR